MKTELLVKADSAGIGLHLAPSPLYSGERDGVRGNVASGATRRTTPHPNPLPRVQGRGDRTCRSEQVPLLGTYAGDYTPRYERTPRATDRALSHPPELVKFNGL